MVMDYNILDMYNCTFKVIKNRIIFKIISFGLNGEEHYCANENKDEGPFSIIFTQPFQPIEVQECSYAQNELHINDDVYLFDETDFGYFVKDLNANEDQAIESVMKYFCQWLLHEENPFKED